MPYTFVRTIVAPQLQIAYIRQSVVSYGVAEMSEQWIESNGRIHVKNVSERRGSGKDLITLGIIAKRAMVVTVMGLTRNILSYFKDISGCKNKDRYKSLWTDKHEAVNRETSFRSATEG